MGNTANYDLDVTKGTGPMNRFFRAVRRINLLIAFLVLFAAHLLLYYALGTDRWATVALTAALTETVVLALAQILIAFKTRAK